MAGIDLGTERRRAGRPTSCGPSRSSKRRSCCSRGRQRTGFAKALFRGEFRGERTLPLPRAAREPAAGRRGGRGGGARVRRDAHRRRGDRPRGRHSPFGDRGAGRAGRAGDGRPTEWGGQGFSQMGYCRIMEVIGGHCAATAVFVNAHHSIGLRALVLFGTPEQQARWLPPLASGEKLAAFALTEEQAGSDASNVQTTARPREDGADLHPERQRSATSPTARSPTC